MPPRSPAKARCSSPMQRSAAGRSPTAITAAGSSSSAPSRPACSITSAIPPSPAASARRRACKRFAKLTGSQRQVGVVFPGDAMRQVFLGTVVLGDERRAMQYGRDEERDVAGFVERIGPGRWRMLMPEPHFKSQIDVLELIPSG